MQHKQRAGALANATGPQTIGCDPMPHREASTGPNASTPLEQTSTADAQPQNPRTTDSAESPVAAPGDSPRECVPNFWGITAHRFEPRFDRVWPNRKMSLSDTLPSTLESAKETLYVHDICTRCGAIVRRAAKENR